jgi:nicotinate dehydrogenase subunit B
VGENQNQNDLRFLRSSVVSDTRVAPEEIAIEPERYELREGPAYAFELERRTFLRVLGGGLVIAAALPRVASAVAEAAQGRAEPAELAAWLHIGEDGRVTVYTGKTELGQNIRTSLAQAVADELRIPLDAVSMVMADTDLVPFDAGTFGSRTTPIMSRMLSRAAATAREMLVDQAAARWQADRATLSVRDGRIIGTGGQSAGYGELTKGQKLSGVVAPEPVVTPADHWTLRGTAPKKVDGRAFVTGAHAFVPDIGSPADGRAPLHGAPNAPRDPVAIGAIVRPETLGATPGAVDDSGAKAMDGVTVVRDGDFIGVVAPTERAARRAAAAVKVEWRAGPPQPDHVTLYDHLKKAATGRGQSPQTAGDTAAAMASAARTFEASYRIPYIAHVPLEPRAAVAEWTDGTLTVWTGTQRPFGVRSELAQAFRIPEERVRVIVPDFGSAYGGKHSGETAVEAARLAQAAGRPVKLVWTRAEEFMWAYFRPAGVIDVRAGVDAAGRLVAWEFDNWNSGAAGIRTPYEIPNQRVRFHPTDSPLRQGSYRALAATANHYAREMHMDDVARGLGVDVVEFRLRHLKDERMRAVLEAAAKQAGWPKPSAAGRALGIACGTEKGSYVATAAELSKTGDGYQVERLVVAFECGAIVHPDGLRNQVEGCVVQGLGGAVAEAIEFRDGRILNGSMQQYPVPRFRDIPPLDIVLLDRKDLPSAGAGETPIVCVAPAIGSAARTFGRVDTALPVKLL